MAKPWLCALILLSSCAVEDVSSTEVALDLPAPGGPGALAPCILQPDGAGGTLATPPGAALNLVGPAMGQWVATQCGPGFRATPRDVTCTFRTDVRDPKAGDKATYRGDDWSPGDVRQRTGGSETFFDAAGTNLGTVQLGAAPPPGAEGNYLGRFGCYLECTGTTSGTLATGAVLGASAVGVPPGFIPLAGEAPAGRTFCTTFQTMLLAGNADCQLAAGVNRWSAPLGDPQRAPWQDTGRTEQTTEERVFAAGSVATHPTAVRSTRVSDYKIWTVAAATLQAACDRVFNATTAAARDQACDAGARRQTVKSVIGAAICIANNQGGGGAGGGGPTPGADEGSGGLELGAGAP